MMNEGATLRVWPPDALSPSAEHVALSGEQALDRELLRAHDGTVSRAANAPKLRALSGAALELFVPEASAWPVLVIEGFRFEGLCPAPPGVWSVAPAELRRAGRLAAGERASACLARALPSASAERTSHYLLPLPPTLTVARGERAVFAGPALLVVGGAALDVTPFITQSPASLPPETAAFEPCPLALAPLQRALEDAAARGTLDALEALASPSPPERAYVLPGRATPLSGAALRDAALALQSELDAPFAFLPLLEDGVRPRLGLALRGDLLISGADPARFLHELRERLEARPIPRARPSAPPAAPYVAPPLSREPLAELHGTRTRSPALAAVIHQLERVASSELRVLFLGESGTGKEHLARTLHAASPRADGPFVAVNCSAIGDQLIESELFGHRKGAFTGAHTERAGAFVSAHRGTLLLDELGDAPLRVQLALLRALETRQIKPVGSDREQPVDVRVLAATSADLRRLLSTGQFREDLYFRLAELVVDVPPLRARPEDIPDLIEVLLKKHQASSKLSPQALKSLIAYPFPGNVRELDNALKRALALSRGAELLEAVHFPQLAPEPEAFEFPPVVRMLADRLWAEPQSAASDGSKYEQRARLRAALLEIGSRFPLEAWPRALQAQWQRLFRETWATTEGGRNVREVARELGLERREESERRVLVLVRSVLGRRVG